MSPKWDDEEESTPPSSPPLVALRPRRKFEDEEDSDEVLDSWEAAEDSEVEREKEAKLAVAKAKAKAEAEAEAEAKKKSRSQRIAERQEANRRRQEEEDEDSSDEEDYITKRNRLKTSEKEADLAHAEDLIGDIDINRTNRRVAPKSGIIADANDPTKSTDLSSLPLFNPTTKTQFTTLTNAVIPILTAHSKKAQYSMWVQDFAKQLVKELPSSEIKKVASALTTASNEKLKEEKAADKSGKKSKAAKTKTSLAGARDTGRVDLTAYDADYGLDDDDFM